MGCEDGRWDGGSGCYGDVKRNVSSCMKDFLEMACFAFLIFGLCVI